jgi:uncharacterized coiled-coil DUF342 family protein
MAKTGTSALAAAAHAFDEALASYTRLGDLFLRSPLETLKHLERANATLTELADSEQRLQATGQQLIAAIASARDQQQALSQQILDRAPALQARNQRLGELMASLQELAAETSKLNEDIAARQREPGDVATAMFALCDRAEQLARSARESDFAELGEQAHALYQRLQAIAKKLETAGGN